MSQPLIMSFRPDAAEMCMDGRKTMTRRIVTRWMEGLTSWGKGSKYMSGSLLTACKGDMFEKFHPEGLTAVSRHVHDGPIIWRVGKSIAIKPGRTCKAVGRVMCTELKVEHVQDITEEDAIREGMTEHPGLGWTDGASRHHYYNSAKRAFEAAWHRLHPRAPNRWVDNPLVVVIGFRPLEEGES